MFDEIPMTSPPREWPASSLGPCGCRAHGHQNGSRNFLGPLVGEPYRAALVHLDRVTGVMPKLSNQRTAQDRLCHSTPRRKT
jgi:hypothetical protein